MLLADGAFEARASHLQSQLSSHALDGVLAGAQSWPRERSVYHSVSIASGESGQGRAGPLAREMRSSRWDNNHSRAVERPGLPLPA